MRPSTAARSTEYALAPVSYDDALPWPAASWTSVPIDHVEFAIVPTPKSDAPRATVSLTYTLYDGPTYTRFQNCEIDRAWFACSPAESPAYACAVALSCIRSGLAMHAASFLWPFRCVWGSCSSAGALSPQAPMVRKRHSVDGSASTRDVSSDVLGSESAP